MAFGIAYRNDTNGIYILDENMTRTWYDTTSDASVYFAVDRTNGYVYTSYYSTNYYIRKYDITDGSVLASYNCTAAGIGEQNAFIVDGSGYVWSFNANNSYLYKWDADLVGYTAYDVGSVVGGQIYNASMTADGSYIYVTGPQGGNRDKVAQLNPSNPAGGANWEQNLGTNNCVYPTVGENGNVYVSGYGTSLRIRKLSVTDGSYLWASPYYIAGGYYNAYCFATDRLYINMYGTTDDHRYYQIDPSDGSRVGYTAALASTAWSCAVYDQDTLYVGGATGGGSPIAIRKFSITNDWGTNESATGSYSGGAVRHYFAGDPTGYINEQITGASSYSDLDGKVEIFIPIVTETLDGKVAVCNYSENDLDGRVNIGYGSSDDFDGKIFLYSSNNPVLDGSIVIYDGVDGYPAPLDGKILIYKHTLKISQLQIKTGTFTGDGTADRSIVGIGFQPSIVFLFSSAYGMLWRTENMTDTYCIDAFGYRRYACLTAIESDGFTVSTYLANELGREVDYIAIRTNDGDTGYLGSYLGNEVDDRDITDISFEPDMVFIGSDSNGLHSPTIATSAGQAFQAAKTVYIASSNALSSNNIQQILSNGFQVGSAQLVNMIGYTYEYLCINDENNIFKTGTYVGNGVDDREITGIGFEPAMVWLFDLSSQELTIERGSNQPSGPDYSYRIGAYGGGTNRIQSFSSDGFQVGTSVEANAVGDTYNYIAFKDGGEYFDPDFNGRVIILKHWSNDFDGKVVVEISNISINSLDGKIQVIGVSESLGDDLDGKVQIINTLESSSEDLDGKIDIYRGREVDGKVLIYTSSSTNLIDGLIEVVFNSIDNFDGQFACVYSSLNDLDGKIEIIGVARLISFHVNNAFNDITYPEREYVDSLGSFNDYIDTRTVAIIGLGQREEYLENEAMLDAADDLTADILDEDDRLYLKFDDDNGSGRYFRVSTYPIVANSLKVYRTYKGTEELLEESEYQCSEQYGYIVLDHPLESYDTMRVTYIASTDINNPRLFIDFDDLKKIYGTPSLDNTLSLAAKMAFENGATRVLACQASIADTYFTNAYSALEKEECYWIVPVPKIGTAYPSIVTAGQTHVLKMSDVRNRKERVLICGEVNNNTETLYRTDAVDMNSKRVILFAPTVSVSLVNDGETLIIDGRFVAASAAGKLSGLENISYPLTNKTLQGFDVDRRYSINFNRNRDTQTGVTFLSLLSSGAEVWHGVTTSQNGVVEDQEISIVRVSDFIISNLRIKLDRLYIGRVIVSNITFAMTGSIRSYLDSLVSSSIIKKYQNITVKADETDTRQIDIAFDVEPIYPLNMFSVSFGYVLI